MEDKCPCKDCICVPMCNNKTYDQLIADCNLLATLLYKTDVIGPANRRSSFTRHIGKIKECLTPTLWKAIIQPNNGFMVITHTMEEGKNKPVMRDYIYDDNDD